MTRRTAWLMMAVLATVLLVNACSAWDRLRYGETGRYDMNTSWTEPANWGTNK